MTSGHPRGLEIGSSRKSPAARHVSLRRDDEDSVRLDTQAVGDQFHGHRGETRKGLMKPAGELSRMVDDDDRDTHVVW
jgi:hypothetical protein